jgi:hypothetical protein
MEALLQAYIDDSKQDVPGLYVLAGYVADESKWLDLEREWNELLAGPPRLSHLKTSDMYQTRSWHTDSVFCGWTREEVDARVLRLATTINKYVIASIQTAVRKEDYANILSGLPNDDPSMNRPYPFLCFSIIQGLVCRLEDMGCTDRVEFCLAHSTAKCNGEIFGVEENLTRSSVAEYLSSDTIERSEPFGKYCLNRPLVCSLRPRSHE